MTTAPCFLFQDGSYLLQDPMEPALYAMTRVVSPYTMCINRDTQPCSLKWQGTPLLLSLLPNSLLQAKTVHTRFESWPIQHQRSTWVQPDCRFILRLSLAAAISLSSPSGEGFLLSGEDNHWFQCQHLSRLMGKLWLQERNLTDWMETALSSVNPFREAALGRAGATSNECFKTQVLG